MDFNCAKGCSHWILGIIPSQKEWIGIGTGCPGNWWSPSVEVFKREPDVALGDPIYGGLGSALLMVGLDLKRLFQPKQFYDARVLVPNIHTLSVAVGRIPTEDIFSISSNNCTFGKTKISFLMTPQHTQNYYSAHDPTSAIPANHKSLHSGPQLPLDVIKKLLVRKAKLLVVNHSVN